MRMKGKKRTTKGEEKDTYVLINLRYKKTTLSNLTLQVTKVINHLPLTRHISVNSPAFFRKNAEILYPTFKVSIHKDNNSMQLL